MPVKNDYKANTRVRSVPYKALVEEQEPNLRDPHKSYDFSKKTFLETDKNGIYDPNA